MKEGDKIYCITSYSIENNSNYHINEGHFYTISRTNIQSKDIHIFTDSGDEWMFTLEKRDNHFYFNEFFVTKNKVRNLKINEINESRGQNSMYKK